MREVQVTVTGNVATPVEFRTTGSGVPSVRFRLASTVRRFDRESQAWSDGSTSFYTVRAWRSLASNVSSSVSLGEPLVVQGRLRVRDEERDGRHHVWAELLASAVGHDLARGTSAFVRTAGGPRPGPPEVLATGQRAAGWSDPWANGLPGRPVPSAVATGPEPPPVPAHPSGAAPFGPAAGLTAPGTGQAMAGAPLTEPAASGAQPTEPAASGAPSPDVASPGRATSDMAPTLAGAPGLNTATGPAGYRPTPTAAAGGTGGAGEPEGSAGATGVPAVGFGPSP